MEPEWGDLKIILALSRAGSVVGAARALGVDQSTISRRLASLEECVGVRLVLRGRREFSLTAEGRAMCTAAEAVETAIGEASRAVRVAKLEVSGTVRVSCPPAFVPHIFAACRGHRGHAGPCARSSSKPRCPDASSVKSLSPCRTSNVERRTGRR